jgi:membrane protease YdiL (CAAX protease family)
LEEFGWRSYLQIRIFKNRPIASAITTGLIWAVWHYPLVLVGYQFPDYPLLGIPVFTVSAVLISIYLGWIRNRSGSVWATSLAHSSLNNLGATLAMVLFLGAENYIFVFFSGILGWIPMALLSFWIMGTGRLQSKEKLPASSKTNPAAAS